MRGGSASHEISNRPEQERERILQAAGEEQQRGELRDVEGERHAARFGFQAARSGGSARAAPR